MSFEPRPFEDLSPRKRVSPLALAAIITFTCLLVMLGWLWYKKSQTDPTPPPPVDPPAISTTTSTSTSPSTSPSTSESSSPSTESSSSSTDPAEPPSMSPPVTTKVPDKNTDPVSTPTKPEVPAAPIPSQTKAVPFPKGFPLPPGAKVVGDGKLSKGHTTFQLDFSKSKDPFNWYRSNLQQEGFYIVESRPQGAGGVFTLQALGDSGTIDLVVSKPKGSVRF